MKSLLRTTGYGGGLKVMRCRQESQIFAFRSMISLLCVLLAAVYVSHSHAYSISRAHVTSVSRSRLLSTVPSIDSSDTLTAEPVKKVRIGGEPQFNIEGDTTVETPFQRVAVSTHATLVLGNIIYALMHLSVTHGSLPMLPVIATFLLSIVVGDFGTGVFHWSVDNYGSINTPIFGSVCEAFQGHHNTPWTITFRSFINNTYKIAIGTFLPLALLTVSGAPDYIRMFMALFINWWLISQEFHKYTHIQKQEGNVPPLWRVLGNAGIILPKSMHGKHHTSPYQDNYCILTGWCNPVLDNSNFFRKLEKIVYETTGNEPNTWNEEKGGEKVREKAMSMI